MKRLKANKNLPESKKCFPDYKNMLASPNAFRNKGINACEINDEHDVKKLFYDSIELQACDIRKMFFIK